jgi:hypothetical protein
MFKTSWPTTNPGNTGCHSQAARSVLCKRLIRIPRLKGRFVFEFTDCQQGGHSGHFPSQGATSPATCSWRNDRPTSASDGAGGSFLSRRRAGHLDSRHRPGSQPNIPIRNIHRGRSRSHRKRSPDETDSNGTPRHNFARWAMVAWMSILPLSHHGRFPGVGLRNPAMRSGNHTGWWVHQRHQRVGIRGCSAKNEQGERRPLLLLIESRRSKWT